MNRSAPNGYFVEGMILYGSPENGGRAAKGYFVRAHDLRGASITRLNEFQEKIRTVLANLGEGMTAQLQWGCNGDFGPEITAYERETATITLPHVKSVRQRTARREWERAQRHELRREHVVLFISISFKGQPAAASTHRRLESYYETVLGHRPQRGGSCVGRGAPRDQKEDRGAHPQRPSRQP